MRVLLLERLSLHCCVRSCINPNSKALIQLWWIFGQSPSVCILRIAQRTLCSRSQNSGPQLIESCLVLICYSRTTQVRMSTLEDTFLSRDLWSAPECARTLG